MGAHHSNTNGFLSHQIWGVHKSSLKMTQRVGIKDGKQNLGKISTLSEASLFVASEISS